MEPGVIEETCPACGSAMQRAFCGSCGERRPARLVVGGVLRDVAAQVADWDTNWLRTVRALAWHPGATCRAYFRGDRSRWINPLKYAFILTTLYILAVLASGLDLRPDSMRTDEHAARSFYLVFTSLAYLALVYLLPVAWIQSRLFWRAGYNTAECYVSLLYLYGQLSLLLLLLVPVQMMLDAKLGVLQREAIVLAAVLLWNASLYRSLSPSMLLRSAVVFFALVLSGAVSGSLLAIAAVLMRRAG